MRFLRVTALWILLLPIVIGFTGAASNQVVLIANHGKFPVMVNDAIAAQVPANGMMDDIHCLMTEKTHLNFLADIFDLKVAIFSIGDFLLQLGEWMWSFCPFVWAFVVITKLRYADLRTNNW